MAKKIAVDADACIGCGACASQAPDYFEMKDGKSHVKKEEIAEKDLEEIEGIKNSCPGGAISISEE